MRSSYKKANLRPKPFPSPTCKRKPELLSSNVNIPKLQKHVILQTIQRITSHLLVYTKNQSLNVCTVYTKMQCLNVPFLLKRQQ